MRPFAMVAVLLLGGTSDVDGETIFFLVGEFPGEEVHRDSYVLALSDPGDIAHARRLIDEGPRIDGAIVLAEISPGADGVNRDHRAAGAPPWSWHISRFLGFADFTIEILDGWPGFVEQDVPGWMANTGGQIGFWSYTVVEELTPVPGDTNWDRRVNLDDLNNVRNHFGAGDGTDLSGIPGDAVPWDGLVNIDDLNAVRNRFGAGPDARHSVPEPGGLGATLLGGLLLLGRYRRPRRIVPRGEGVIREI